MVAAVGLLQPLREQSYLQLKYYTHSGEVNLLGDNIDTTKENIETLIDARKEVGLEINVENEIYVSISSPKSRSKSEHKNSK
jgi:biotin operon repressor